LRNSMTADPEVKIRNRRQNGAQSIDSNPVSIA